MICSDCRGTGRIPLFTSVATCERCKGTGRRDVPVNETVYPVSDFSNVKIESEPDGEGGYRLTRTFIVEGID